MGIALAICAAIGFGAGNFVSGFALQRMPTRQVSALVHTTEFILFLAISPLTGGGCGSSAIIWGSACGLAYAAGLRLLFSALQTGHTTLVAPVYAMSVALVPIAFGLIAGERPNMLAWMGIALAVAGAVLLSRKQGDPFTAAGEHWKPQLPAVCLAAGAGLAFGLGFVFISKSADGDGLWPFVVAMGISSIVLWAGMLRARAGMAWTVRSVGTVVAAGALLFCGNIAALSAFRNGMLSVTGALVGLGPAVLVILAVVLRSERAGLSRSAGLVLSFISVSCLSGSTHAATPAAGSK